MSDLLITNVDVLTNEGVLKNHAIEIENGFIRLVKWTLVDGTSQRVLLEEKPLTELLG